MCGSAPPRSDDEHVIQSLELLKLFYSLDNVSDRNRLFEMAKFFVKELGKIE